MVSFNKSKYFGDQYLETEDWFAKLPKDLLDTLMFNQVTPVSINQAWYMFRGYPAKYQHALGQIIVATFMRDHPEYAEKIRKRDLPKNINKEPSYDMFR